MPEFRCLLNQQRSSQCSWQSVGVPEILISFICWALRCLPSPSSPIRETRPAAPVWVVVMAAAV